MDKSDLRPFFRNRIWVAKAIVIAMIITYPLIAVYLFFWVIFSAAYNYGDWNIFMDFLRDCKKILNIDEEDLT